LHSTGHYGLANVIILVLLLPFLMFFLLVKNLELYNQIKNLNSKS
jgi:predicted PurR-regulated permease PerM